MKGSRNKKENSNFKHEEDVDKGKECADGKDIDLDFSNESGGGSDGYLSGNFSFDEEIDKKINSIKENNRNNFFREEKISQIDNKNVKNNKQKYDKKILKDNFND